MAKSSPGTYNTLWILLGAAMLGQICVYATAYTLAIVMLSVALLVYWIMSLQSLQSLNLLSTGVLGFYGLVPTTFYIREFLLQTPYEDWLDLVDNGEKAVALSWYITSMVALQCGIRFTSRANGDEPLSRRFDVPRTSIGLQMALLISAVGLCGILLTRYLFLRTTEWGEASTIEDLRRAMLAFGLVPPLMVLCANRRSPVLLIALAIMTGTLVAMAGTGNRRLFVTAVLTVAACMFMQRGIALSRAKISLVGVLGILGYAAMSVLGVYRQKIQRGEITSISDALTVHIDDIIPLYGVHEGIMFFSFNFFLRTTNEVGGFVSSFVRELLPSFVRGGDTYFVTVTDYIAQHCYPFYGQNDTNIGVLLSTELLLNGGIPVLILGMAIIGAAVGWLERLNSSEASPLVRYGYFVLVGYTAHFVYYNRTLLLKFLVLGAIVLVVFMGATIHGSRRLQVPGRALVAPR